MIFYSKKRYYLFFFTLALSIRCLIIFFSPNQNNNIDLQIYRNAGQLVTHEINPYDFNDNVKLRNELRLDSNSYNEWISESQERWDYYSNSNLPMATLFFGGIEFIFNTPIAYRFIFAFFDSILSLLLFVFIFEKWDFELLFKNKFCSKYKKHFPYIVGLLIGVLNPIFLVWGTLMPEHKGIGLLMILSAIYFSEKNQKIYSLTLSPILLGSSISFIGLGVFIAPICFYNVYNKHNFKALIYYSVVALLFSIIWLLPFMPELLNMMVSRTSIENPASGSMWSIIYKLWPNNWSFLKYVFTSSFIFILLAGFIRKRLNMNILFASILYLFLCVYLINGSLDRMNIALIILIVLLGSSKYINMAISLLLFHVLYGVFIITEIFIGILFSVNKINEIYDSVFMVTFSITYLLFLSYQTFKPKISNNEAKHCNTFL